MICCLEKTQKSKIFYDLNNFNFTIWEACYPKFDFLICISYRSQCLESHGIVYFAYKLLYRKLLHNTVQTAV